MANATFNKFYNFGLAMGKKEHDLNSDTIKVYLSNATPSAENDADKSDLAEISGGNGYTAGGDDIQNSYTRSGGTSTLTGVDVTFTASGGSIGPFRYVVLYNDTHSSDGLIGWWDYGFSLTLTDGQSLLVDFGTSILTVT
jgi:hypothetical protein